MLLWVGNPSQLMGFAGLLKAALANCIFPRFPGPQSRTTDPLLFPPGPYTVLACEPGSWPSALRLARQAAAPRLWMAVSKQASRNSSTQGTRARGRGVPAQATHCPPPRTRPPWHSHFSWHRDSQELSQPVPFTSVCPGLLNF